MQIGTPSKFNVEPENDTFQKGSPVPKGAIFRDVCIHLSGKKAISGKSHVLRDCFFLWDH